MAKLSYKITANSQKEELAFQKALFYNFDFTGCFEFLLQFSGMRSNQLEVTQQLATGLLKREENLSWLV